MEPLDKRLSVHHIGGRVGSRAFPVLPKFEPDIINVLYDADPDCLAQVQENNKNLQSELHVLPYCFADDCKPISFNINYDPYTSSLYESNPEYGVYYYFYGDHDYVWAEATKTMEKRNIEAVTIDHVFHSANVRVPPPNYLSIDTQGSEYDILLGAKETLKSSVLALVIETEFHPLYIGQKLFGDLVQLLSDQGFEFARFLETVSMAPFRAPVTFRGEGFHVYAEALFLRRIDNLENVISDETRLYYMLRKLAFIAIVHNQFEYGLECLHRSQHLVRHRSAMQEKPNYCRFLKDLEDKLRMQRTYPCTFASKYTFAESRARFDRSVDRARAVYSIKRFKEILRRFPVVYSLLRRSKRLLIKISHVIASLRKSYSNVETVLLNYGLESQARILWENRIVQSKYCKKT